MESDVRLSQKLPAMGDKFEKYDVFISHRGPDTKTGFVSFLYKDLEGAGLRPFLDCNSIDIGQDSWECIDHAIKKAPIALVIFSENFAQSEWCLRELHVMLNTPCVKVLPIFYKIKPSDVRFPESGQLKDGFEKLKKRHDKAVIEQWRADLTQASKLMGWEHSGAPRRLEGELVTEVVGTIFELANKLLSLDVGEYIVGVKEVADGIIQTLDKNKVMMLGLWGMGGIGKSTLARELYNRLHKRFAASCYVADVRDKVIQGGAGRGVAEVQNRLLKDLCMDESTMIIDKHKGKPILEERLCKKQILVVLDDVWDSDNMNYTITRKMLVEGSLCIVTSRDERVFEQLNSFDFKHEVHIHNVQVLDNENSKQVFSSYVFGGACKVKQGYEKLVTNISTACGGVPLILKVCGALFKEENMDTCGAIVKENKIFESLWISFDACPQQDQEMFLDIACALLGQSHDMAIHVWKSHGWFPISGARNCIKKTLIVVDDKGCFIMHDHLRDMGREIARTKTCGGVCIRLWMLESILLVKENKLLPESLETLILSNDYGYMNRYGSNSNYDYYHDFDHNGIDVDLFHIKSLRILICTTDKDLRLRLPQNLQWLEAKCYRIPILAEKVQYLSNLEVLSQLDCRDLINLPDSFGGLKDLKNLDLQSSGIKTLPEPFGNLSNLKVLSLLDCADLIVLPDSFGGLKNLKDLDLQSSGIKTLPEPFGNLSNLKVLSLLDCADLIVLPDSFGGLKNLKDLDLQSSGIKTLPEPFGNLSNLKVLSLLDCVDLIVLPDSFGGLKNLKDLDLQSSGIKTLPESFGNLSNLEVLKLAWCGDLINLPNLFGGLKELKDLDLQSSGIKTVPESIGNLSNLEVLSLLDHADLIVLPDSFRGLKNLKNLDFYSSRIKTLPKAFGNLSKLEVLSLLDCADLIVLPDSFGGLKELKDLDLQSSGIKTLPESFKNLRNLEVLSLLDCADLIVLPDSFGGLKELKDLDLQISGIKTLPEPFENLSNLKVLNLLDCADLIVLPDSFGGLKNLKDLDLQSSGIKTLPEPFGNLSNLKVLSLLDCADLIVLPDSFGGLKNLKDLDLQSSGIKTLPEPFGNLSNLEVLKLAWCGDLINLPDSFGGLKNLKDLDLQSSGIKTLPEPFGNLSNLEVLKLAWCGDLINLPDSFGGLKNLKDLDL